MTYFYGQLFATGTEIRTMFPATMDVQRCGIAARPATLIRYDLSNEA